jgi:DNA repair protein RadC
MDYELLELLLTYAIPRRDVRPLARELLKTFGSVYNVLVAPIESLMRVVGIKENTAVLVKSVQELIITGHKNYLDSTPIFHDSKKLAEYCRLTLSGKPVEEFHILYLDVNYRLLSDDLHSCGTVDWAAVYPREIVKRALELNANSIVMLHNHPDGKTSFSKDDILTTEKIKKILASVGVSVYDHMLVSGAIVHSARNMFLLKD